MAFHFFETDSHVAAYNQFRPCPPYGLIKHIVKYLGTKIKEPPKVAVDVGCGGGQSTRVLAPYFEQVMGLDISNKQIEEAQANNKLPNITYKISSAEEIDVPDESVDLVTASQACHWFDMDKFYSHVRRILRPGGVLALYGYKYPEVYHKETGCELSDIIDKYIGEFSEYALPNVLKAIMGYKDKEFNHFPFAKEVVRNESIFLEIAYTLTDLTGYISSLKQFQKYVSKESSDKGFAILKNFENEILEKLQMPNTEPDNILLSVVFEFFVVMGSKRLD